jgi:proline iminopeptidase
MCAEVSTETRVTDGLAVYSGGAGEPVLLMPYSHAFTTCRMIETPLASMLADMGRQVITFDPPGSYRSNRAPRMDIAEMVECALEALDVASVRGRVDVVGHSMGRSVPPYLPPRIPTGSLGSC